MVCRNCGKRFSSVKINEVKGGCNPAPLNRKIEGETLMIQVAHVLRPWWKIDGQSPGEDGILLGAEASRILGLGQGDALDAKVMAIRQVVKGRMETLGH